MTADQTIADAVDELARESLSQQFRSAITADDARDYVDAEMVSAWLEVESRTSTATLISVEALEDIPEDHWRTILLLLLGPTDAAQALLSAHLRMHIAKYLAKRAEEAADELEEA